MTRMTKKLTEDAAAADKVKVLRSANTSTDMDTAIAAVKAVGVDLADPTTTGTAYKSLHVTRLERKIVKALQRAQGNLHKPNA